MTSMVFEWVKVDVDELPDMEDSYLYALVRNRRLLYIGMSYHTNVALEVKQNMASFGLSARNLKVYLAYVGGGNVGRITRPLVHDIEALLIYDNQPDSNVHHKATYTGRDNLKVTNRGCGSLKRRSTAEWRKQ
jgi:hypothetical protein